MYPRNAASPERISIGPVVQISDGAVQTAGVTVRVLPFGGSEADGVGTVAYSTDGVVVYTPTQAETNYTSLVLIAKKTGCIPASVTVVTSESTVSGRVYVATNSDKTGYTATVSDKTGFSLLAGTGLGNQTANITGNLSGSVGSVTGAVGSVTAGVTVSDKTGFKLASDGLAQVASWTVAITGNITGNLSGSVGSIFGVTFPSNFAALGINTSGHLSRVVLVDTTTTNTDMRGTDGAALASQWTSTRAGYLDGVLIAANYSQRTVSVTSTNHVAAVLHDANANSIPENAFVTGALSARALAADAVAEIADGVWDEATSGHTTAGTTGKALIDSGAAGNPWSTDLSTGYSGTQAGSILNEVKVKTDTITTPTINVYPVSASTPERVAGTTLTFYRNESRSVSVVTDFTLTSLTLQFTVEDQDGADIYTLANGSISRSSQTFTVSVTTAVTGGLGQYRWSMRDISGGGSSVIAMGVLTVQEAASNA